MCAAGLAAGDVSLAANTTTHGAGAAGGSAAMPGTAASNASTAHADAESLLQTLSLPAGTTPSSTEPAGDRGWLAHPGLDAPASPNVVDVHAWWIVPGSRAEVLAYLTAYPPTGSTLGPSATAAADGVTTYESQTFAWPAVADVLTTRRLVVTVTQLPNGSIGLRADAQVIWVTPRPASEAIPRGARLLRVSVLSEIKVKLPPQRPFKVVSAKRIEGLVALLNALPGGQPGITNCPLDFGISVRLAFYARAAAKPSAVARIDPYGCGGVRLTIGGAPQPPLEGHSLPGAGSSQRASLILRIDRLLGIKLEVRPRSLAHVSIVTSVPIGVYG
jgi:hypothetical protein